MEICCSHCGKSLTQVPDGSNLGTIAYLVREAGYHPKNAFLYTGKSAWFNFCSRECQRFYYLDVLQIPPAKLDAVEEKMKVIRAGIPAMAKATAEVIQKFSDELYRHLPPEHRPPLS